MIFFTKSWKISVRTSDFFRPVLTGSFTGCFLTGSFTVYLLTGNWQFYLNCAIIPVYVHLFLTIKRKLSEAVSRSRLPSG